MPSDSGLEIISRQLFGVDEKAATYAIIDGASVKELLKAIDEEELESVCLLKGDLDPELVAAAPHLVRIEQESAFVKWILKDGWGKHWGIYVRSKADLRRMRMHFRALLDVYGPDGQPLFFRYYDPRVLRAYLPTCTADELNTVFGPAEHFVMENDDASMLLRFGLSDDDELKFEEFLLN